MSTKRYLVLGLLAALYTLLIAGAAALFGISGSLKDRLGVAEIEISRNIDGTYRILRIPNYPRADHFETLERIGSRQRYLEGAYPIRRFSWEQERLIGFPVARDIEGFFGVIDDPVVRGYVRNIGFRLVAASDVVEAEGMQVTFEILNTPMVNAFMVIGGYGYVTRGLLEQTQNTAQLAAVMGHEIGHYTARHVARRIEYPTGNRLLDNARGRAMELEADQLGLQYSWKAGYAPDQLIFVWNLFGPPYRLEHPFQTHPIPLVRQWNTYRDMLRFPGELEGNLREIEHNAVLAVLARIEGGANNPVPAGLIDDRLVISEFPIPGGN